MKVKSSFNDGCQQITLHIANLTSRRQCKPGLELEVEGKVDLT